MRALALQFRAYPSFFNVKNQRAIRGVAQVPVPTVLPRGFLACRSRARAGGRLGGGQPVDDAEGLIKKNPLIVVNDGIDLGFDIVPNSVEAVLTEL